MPGWLSLFRTVANPVVVGPTVQRNWQEVGHKIVIYSWSKYFRDNFINSPAAVQDHSRVPRRLLVAGVMLKKEAAIVTLFTAGRAITPGYKHAADTGDILQHFNHIYI